MCGEYITALGGVHSIAGSPPRVRGIPIPLLYSPANARITPACAGNTWTGTRAAKLDRDHPRVCGEYSAHCEKVPHHGGSPPRVRGILTKRHNGPLSSGITPACAGNTYVRFAKVGYEGDHPRVCGEYLFVSLDR